MHVSERTAADRPRRSLILAVKLLAALVVIAAPALVAEIFTPGATGVAFYGVLVAAFGWVSGGPRVAAAGVVALTVFGSVSILLREQVWALALILVLLGVGYGFAASRGVGKAALQLPILVPYFMHSPPTLLDDPPVFGPAYYFTLTVIMFSMGAWTILLLRFTGMRPRLTPAAVAAPSVSLAYGAVLGILSACIMVLGTVSGAETHWIWITLTLYVLTDPQNVFTPQRMLGRVMGTLAGFVVVLLLALVSLPTLAIEVIALLALWACVMFMMLKKQYWQYVLFLTVAVVLLGVAAGDTLLLDIERLGFTVVGALLSILSAIVVNAIAHRRVALTASEDQRAR